MKELVIVSGKGGTGKTSIAAALAYLAPSKVLVDCDVDAANLHLVSEAVTKERHNFNAGFEPAVREELCTRCGKCTSLCRFGAIMDGQVKALNCEGCGVCAFNCPAHAISMQEKQAGEWFVSDTRFGQLIHAELGLAVENSGKLVSQVRQEGKRIAERKNLPLVLIDGPPGIGCPAIAALSGASHALAVVEPSLSSLHDLVRLGELIAHFQLPMAVCINKSTLQPDNVQRITDWCAANNVPVVGQIPYSDAFRTAVQAGKTVLDIPDEEVAQPLRALWQAMARLLEIPAEEGVAKLFWHKLNIFQS